MRNYLALIFSFCILVTHSQHDCISDSLMDLSLRDNPEVRNIFLGGYHGSRDYEEIERKTLPIVFHICHNGEEYGEGTHLSEDVVMNKLDTINLAYDGLYTHPYYNLPISSLDTKIDFCLVNEVDENNNSIGIQYHDLTAIENYNDSIPPWSGVNNGIFSSMKVENSINIFVGFNETMPYAGIMGAGLDIVVKEWHFSNNPITSIHEIGHMLGLRHIYHGYGWWDCESALAETDCANQGDLVCDTPPTVASVCSASQCDGQMEPHNNYMGQCNSGNLFTLGQVERMHYILENINPSGIMDGLSLCHSYHCVWDLNGDGIVALSDLIQFLSVMNTEVEVYEGDFNINGTADTNDLLELLSYFSFNCVTEEMSN